MHRLGLRVVQVGLLVTVIVAWELSVRAAIISPLLVPLPSEVGVALAAGLSKGPGDRAGWYYHILATLRGALIGLTIGAATGVIVAAIMSEFTAVWRVLAPYIVTMQVTPKIAIAPLFVIWLGTGLGPKIAIVTLLTFFPTLINSLAGFNSVEQARLDFARSIRANRRQLFWSIKVPSSLPHIFAGLNIAAVFAITGTVVAEFVSGQSGLGARVITLTRVYDQPGVFAALFLLAMLGLAMFGVMQFAQRKLLFWAETQETIVGS